MNSQLYPHNQQAYEKVMQAFQTTNKTCVIHPTGTGKSFIVSAVADHFDKILILGPNHFVLGQVKKTLDARGKIADYYTYVYLLTHTINEHYRLIVLDEFHRLGASKWREKVQDILDRNPQAKVLGCSATPIRSCDNKNMAEELFDNNIASQISLAEVWDSDSPILPIPTYVLGLINLDSTIRDAKAAINKSKSLSAEDKLQRMETLHNYQLNWKKSSGMPVILKKHLSKDTGKMIVFCDHVFNIETTINNLYKWFKKAKIPVLSISCIHSKMKKAQVRRIMRDFEKTDFIGGITILVAVNMLNEGIHVPKVNAIMLLRITESNIIYLQQIGRCLTVTADSNPIILDMVSNLKNANRAAIKESVENTSTHGRHKRKNIPEGFKLIDYTLEVQQLIDSIVPNIYTIPPMERALIVDAFYNENGRLPKANDRKDIYNHLCFLRRYFFDSPEIQSFFKKWKCQKRRSVEDYIKLVEDFYNTHNRLPISEEKPLYNIWHSTLLHDHADDPAVQSFRNKIKYKTIKRKELEKERCLQIVKEAKNKKVNISSLPEYRWLQNNNPEEFQKIKKYNTEVVNEKLTEVLQFCEQTGYLPRHRVSTERSFYKNFRLFSKMFPNHPIVKEIKAKYKHAKHGNHKKKDPS